MNLKIPQNEEYKVFCGMLDSLAFLSKDDITDGLNYQRSAPPPEP